MITFLPKPKPGTKKKIQKDWAGFAIKKLSVKLEGYEYAKFKKSILERDNFTCKKCGRQFMSSDLTLHHIMKRSILRKDTADNVITLCLSCHQEKHMKG